MDHAGLVATFPDGATGAIGGVNVRYVVSTDILHYKTNAILLPRRRQDMDVVRHQDIGVNRTIVTLRRLSHPTQICGIVTFLEKHRFATTATLNHVGGYTG